MAGNNPKTVCLACSVFKRELEELRRRGEILPETRYVDSSLHMKPQELETQLRPMVEDELQAGHRVVLLYGDCHARMVDVERRPGTARTPGVNCCQILLGREEYRRLRKEGAFFLLPEWAIRWREFFQASMELSQTNATDLMGDTHTRLLYLDTGILPVPTEDLQAFSDYCGLPWEVIAISLENLLQSIAETEQRLDSTEPHNGTSG